MPRRIRIGYPRAVRMSGDPGAYAASGQVAALLKGSKVTADQGAYSVTGQDAAFSTSGSAVSSADWVTRSTGSGVVWAHNFAAQTEVTAFRQNLGPSQEKELATDLEWVTDPLVGRAIKFRHLGAKIAVNFPASGGVGPRTMVLDDASDWPTGNFYFYTTAIGANASQQARWYCSTRSGNNLTVTLDDYALVDWPVGSAAGGPSATWLRPFSALSGADNGKGVDDPAASNTVSVRSRIIGNPKYVPQTPSLFGYGAYGHTDYHTDPRFSPWLPSNWPGGDSTSRAGVWDGNEFWLQFRLWVGPEFWLNHVLANPASDSHWSRKVWMLQADATVPQQLTAGIRPSTVYDIPSTNESPFQLSRFNGASSAGGTVSTDYTGNGGGSYQPGSAWATTAQYAVSYQSSVNQATPDGNTAWEYKSGQWLTFLVHMKPGKVWNRNTYTRYNFVVANQTFELLTAPDEWPTANFQVRFPADPDKGYAGDLVFNVAARNGAVFTGVTLVSGSPPSTILADVKVWKEPAFPAGANALSSLIEVMVAERGGPYQTILSVTNYPLEYGSNGQAAGTYYQSVPGYNAIWFTGYLNQGLTWTAPIRTYDIKVSEVIFSKAPIPAPADLPTWVPAPGRVATLTVANGKLTNTFASQAAPWYGGFYAAGIVNGFSGSVVNPYYGPYGSIMFEGGGHTDTNDNSVIQLELGATACTFRRLTNPTAFFGTGSDSTTQANNAKATVAYDQTRLEYTFDGQPMSRHSYGAQEVIGPQHGGATYGTFLRIQANSVGDDGYPGGVGETPHKVDITSTSGTMAWARAGSTGRNNYVGGAPVWTAHVPSQKRVYIEENSASYQPRWFDLVTQTYVQGTGTARNGALMNTSDGGMMLHIPSRGLMLFMGRDVSGNLSVITMDVTASQPSWNNTLRTLSATIPVATSWSQACWCLDNNRIIVGNVNGDPDCIYEIDIPSNLGNPWTCTRVAFTGGDTILWGNPGSADVAYKKWSYNPMTRSINYMIYAAGGSVPGVDTVYVYRPRNT